MNKILEIYLLSCLHYSLFCCDNSILFGDGNLTGAFSLSDAVKNSLSKLTSFLNFMFSVWQFLHIFSDCKTNN